jgi:hypothetical protein
VTPQLQGGEAERLGPKNKTTITNDEASLLREAFWWHFYLFINKHRE